MKKTEEVVDFDLSILNLQDLVKVYENITGFLQFLNTSKIELEEKVEKNE